MALDLEWPGIWIEGTYIGKRGVQREWKTDREIERKTERKKERNKDETIQWQTVKLNTCTLQ